MKTPSRTLCPRFHRAAELIGRRWTGAILWLLRSGPAGFAELRDAIPGVSDRMLSERLRELECEEIVSRGVLPGPPLRVQYTLSAKGEALGEALNAIAQWGEKFGAAPRASGTTRKAARR